VNSPTEAESKEKRSVWDPMLMSTPESTPTYLPWASQSLLFPPASDFGFGLRYQPPTDRTNAQTWSSLLRKVVRIALTLISWYFCNYKQKLFYSMQLHVSFRG